MLGSRCHACIPTPGAFVRWSVRAKPVILRTSVLWVNPGLSGGGLSMIIEPNRKSEKAFIVLSCDSLHKDDLEKTGWSCHSTPGARAPRCV